MTTVYYNFPPILIPMEGTDYTKEIQLPTVGQPLTNIQLNDTNYTAYSIIIAQTSNNVAASTNPGYLIVKCYADINDTTSNLIYFSVPLVVPPPTSGESASSDVDKIINATGGASTLTLNTYIKTGGICVVPPASFPLTITLGPESAIPIQFSQASFQKFYNSSKISPAINLDSNVSQNKNATLQQQDLDWIMSCELLTEDGPPKAQAVDPGTTATTISLFMMAIMIAGSTYIMGPIVYKESGLYALADKVMKGNHYSVNVYWGIALLLTAFLTVIQAIKSNHTTYYFIGIALGLSYFAGTSGVLKLDGIANAQGNGFKNTDSTFGIYYEILFGECSSATGKFVKWGVFAWFISSFIGMTVAMGLGVDTAFITSLVTFIGVAFFQLIVVKYFSNSNA